jgi:hypothetical protein
VIARTSCTISIAFDYQAQMLGQDSFVFVSNVITFLGAQPSRLPSFSAAREGDG